jgi:hypothetical protein
VRKSSGEPFGEANMTLCSGEYNSLSPPQRDLRVVSTRHAIVPGAWFNPCSSYGCLSSFFPFERLHAPSAPPKKSFIMALGMPHEGSFPSAVLVFSFTVRLHEKTVFRSLCAWRGFELSYTWCWTPEDMGHSCLSLSQVKAGFGRASRLH